MVKARAFMSSVPCVRTRQFGHCFCCVATFGERRQRQAETHGQPILDQRQCALLQARAVGGHRKADARALQRPLATYTA